MGNQANHPGGRRSTDGVDRMDRLSGSGSASVPASECRAALQAERSPDGTAVHLSTGRVSWSELNRLVRRRVAERRSAPAVLSIRARPSLDLLVEILAASRQGRVIALVSPRLPTGPAEQFVRETGATWLESPAVEPGTSVSSGTSVSLVTSVSPAASAPPAEDPDTHADSARSGIPSPDAPLTFMQTSGSSGRPQIIAHSWRNHTASACLATGALDIGEEDRWYWSLPPHHVGGLSILFRCLESGTALILPEPARSGAHLNIAPDAIQGANPGADPEERATVPERTLHSALLQTESTIVSCVPVQLRRLIREGPCPPTLRTIIVGGGPLDEHLLRDAIAAGYPVRTTYGCTESSSMVTLSDPFTAIPDIVHAGTPLEEGAVAIGTDGTIRLRGPVVAVGTVEEGEIHPITHDFGWYETGDLGRIDNNGCLIVTGRTDDVFISGGENISARTLEEALAGLSGVSRVVVVPVAHPEFGQRPAAFLDIEGSLPGPAEVERHLSGRLPRFMHPDIVLSLGPPPEGYLKWPRDLLIQRASSTRKD